MQPSDMCNVHFIEDRCSGCQECRKPDLPFCPGAWQDMPGGRQLLALQHILVHGALPVPDSHRHAGHTPIICSPLSLANFQIEVLPQGKAWQDVPGVQGDPRSCIVVPSGLATPLLVLEGDDPPQPQPICAFLFSIPVGRQLPNFARRTDSHL